MQIVVFHCFAYTCCTASFQSFCGMSAIRYKVLTDRAFSQVCYRTLVEYKGSGFLGNFCGLQYYNTQRPCFAIGYDTPENYRKRYYKGELPRKQTFENRVLSPEPKFVQKKRQLSDNKDTYKGVSTFEKEIPEKS